MEYFSPLVGKAGACALRSQPRGASDGLECDRHFDDAVASGTECSLVRTKTQALPTIVAGKRDDEAIALTYTVDTAASSAS